MKIKILNIHNPPRKGIFVSDNPVCMMTICPKQSRVSSLKQTYCMAWSAGLRSSGLCLLATDGFTKTLIVHLEGGSYLGTGLHSQWDSGLFLPEFGSLFESWGSGMQSSPVSDTERAVFAERKPIGVTLHAG